MYNKIINYLKQIEEKNIFMEWYNSQPISARMGFYSAIIISLLTHIHAYSNLILEWHLPGFTRAWSNDVSGRWFQHQVNRLNFYYMNWATGLMQVLFLSLTVFIIIKAFNVKGKLHAILTAGIMVTFPAVAETNIYFHDAAPYFMGALLSIAGFYVTKLYKFGWVGGTVLIMFSLAIYQPKISLAMMASLVHLIIFILKENPKFINFIKYAVRYLLLIIGGLAMYYVSLQVLNISPTYRGMGDLSVSSIAIGIYSDILRAYREVYYYFFSNSFRIDNQFLIIAYGFILLLGLCLLIIITVKSIGKEVSNICLAAILLLLLPLAANFTRVLDSESPVVILAVSSYSFVFFLILPIVLYENFNEKINTYGFKKLVALVLVFVMGYYVVFSNFVYQAGEVISMHAIQLANRISAVIEPLLPYSDNNQVFINGNLRLNPIYPHRGYFPEYNPRAVHVDLLGGANNFATWPQNFFANVIRYRIGLDINHPTGGNERRQYLLDRAITYGMPAYPQEGSIAIIDGVVVVILNFFGRLDVEESTANNFTAVANHIAKATDLEFEYIWYIYRDGQRLEQIYRDYEGIGYINYEINEPGSYQFRVFVRFSGGQNIINFFSTRFEVE